MTGALTGVLGVLGFMAAAPLLCAADFMRSVRRELRCQRETRDELVNGVADDSLDEDAIEVVL